eukprot:2662881-Rhodomonas_salina.1
MNAPCDACYSELTVLPGDVFDAAAPKITHVAFRLAFYVSISCPVLTRRVLLVGSERKASAPTRQPAICDGKVRGE